MDPEWGLVVAAVGDTSSTPQGARHRHLQLRWWQLPDLPPAPPGGLPSTSSTSVVPAVGPTASTPQGARHRCLQLLDLQLWHLMDLGWGPLVAAVGDIDNTPQGACHRRLQLQWWPVSDLPPAPPRRPAIDVFNFGGCHCRTCRLHPPWGLPSTSSTSGPPAPAPPGAHRQRFLALMVGAPGPPAPAPPRGPPSTAE
jgi:hypothetical protein